MITGRINQFTCYESVDVVVVELARKQQQQQQQQQMEDLLESSNMHYSLSIVEKEICHYFSNSKVCSSFVSSQPVAGC